MPQSSPRGAAPGIRRRRSKKSSLTIHVSEFNSMVLPWARDWAELPLDALLYVFHRLDPVELLMGGAAVVCRSWRRAARHEPELWRRIDLRGPLVRHFKREGFSPGRLARAALRLSAGRCEAFWCKYGVDEDLLFFLVEQAPLLKTLHLVTSYSEVFAEAIKKFLVLEELELALFDSISRNKVLDFVSKACPRLKHFKHMVRRPVHRHCRRTNNNMEALTIARMAELRPLQLFGDNLNNEGLTTILEKCPRLEYLNLRGCRYIDMDGDLRAKCDRIKTKAVFPHDYSYYGYLDREGPNWGCHCLTCTMYRDDLWLDLYMHSLYEENDDDYYRGDDIDEADLEEHERVLDNKRMRRYLS